MRLTDVECLHSQGMDMDAYMSRLSALKDDIFKKHAAYARKVSLGLQCVSSVWLWE